jgi:hypothetical protein
MVPKVYRIKENGHFSINTIYGKGGQNFLQTEKKEKEVLK